MTKENRNNRNIPVPPADIILGLLNDDPSTDKVFLDFYDSYIHAAATEPRFTSEGDFDSYILNDDLLQEIKITLVRSLPVLRRKILDYLNGEPVFVIVVADKLLD